MSSCKKFLAIVSVMLCALAVQAAAQASQQAVPGANQAAPQVSDQDIQLLREDIRSQKKQIVAANLQLTDAEATKFWPVYDAYTQAITKVGDSRTALIKEYAANYNTLTDAQAKSLIQRASAVDEQLVATRAQWMPKFEAVLPGKKAAVFFQLDRRIGLLIDLQLASMIPLVQQ